MVDPVLADKVELSSGPEPHDLEIFISGSADPLVLCATPQSQPPSAFGLGLVSGLGDRIPVARWFSPVIGFHCSLRIRVRPGSTASDESDLLLRGIGILVVQASSSRLLVSGANGALSLGGTTHEDVP